MIFDWIKRRREPRQGDTLASRLRSYPPYEAPNAGRGTALSPDQAAENLACFEQVLPQRLQQVSALLEVAGIDTRAALADPSTHAAALADELQRWALAQWPALPAEGGLARWLDSRRSGEHIVFSMLLDLAILLGELVRRGNPDWHWGLDLDAQNLADGMLSARRIVLLADPVGTHTTPFVLEVEAIVVHRFLHADDPAQRLLNPLRRLVEEGLRGDAMACWRQAG
ncbi:MAG: hypothetical protein QM702_05800 [Rubrivivax sp.]